MAAERQMGGPLLLAAVALLASAAVFLGDRRAAEQLPGLSDDRAVIARGEAICAANCTRCRGARLEGQADWQSPRAEIPAPPHNSDVPTWHDNATLAGITKHGLVPPWAPSGYRIGMPKFAGVLSEDEIWAVLSFIASTWNEEGRSWQPQVEAQAPMTAFSQTGPDADERNTRVDTSENSAVTPSLARDLAPAARYYLSGRRGLLILAAVIVVAGVALNWNWLAVAGIAPLLVAVLPCAAMCALGLCMSRMGGSRAPQDAALDVKARQTSHGPPKASGSGN